jgi:hypothetical protein
MLKIAWDAVDFRLIWIDSWRHFRSKIARKNKFDANFHQYGMQLTCMASVNRENDSLSKWIELNGGRGLSGNWALHDGRGPINHVSQRVMSSRSYIKTHTKLKQTLNWAVTERCMTAGGPLYENITYIILTKGNCAIWLGWVNICSRS